MKPMRRLNFAVTKFATILGHLFYIGSRHFHADPANQSPAVLVEPSTAGAYD